MGIVRVLALVAFLAALCSADVSFKNLAGPPSEFDLYTLPTPQQNADVQSSATFYVQLQPTPQANVLGQVIQLPVDSTTRFMFVFYSPSASVITLALTDPHGERVQLNGITSSFPISDDTSVPATAYDFQNPVQGVYTLTITTTSLEASVYNALLSSKGSDAYISLWNSDAISTHTYLNTYSLVAGSQVGLVTRAFDNTLITTAELSAGVVPPAMPHIVKAASMTVELPNGAVVSTPMQDDGLRNDGAADDGVFGALITATVPGDYIFTANITGVNNGVPFVRTTTQLVTVVDKDLALTGSALGVMNSETRYTILLGVNAPVGKKYRVYAEAYSTDANSNAVPVAWIGGMAVVAEQSGLVSLAVELDLNWAFLAGTATGAFTLRNVIVQEPNTFIPVAQADSIAVKSAFSIEAYLKSIHPNKKPSDIAITEEMREGVRPEWLRNITMSDDASATIILVHGYCSSVNPWASNPSDWTNGQYFLSPGKNRPHDDFALAVLEWATPFGAYSYVGHSQGGAVGLHLKNYYWSGLDKVKDGRILQSVGTPYQGSSGAGSAADLAKLFGVLCGANHDLTKDGSALWLKGITAANRALVYYYTTTYVQGKTFGDYCNLIVNLVLNWPNDGVSELEYAQLPGGKNQGNTEAWCHSADMKYPAQYTDRTRNALMNKNAARTISA